LKTALSDVLEGPEEYTWMFIFKPIFRPNFKQHYAIQTKQAEKQRHFQPIFLDNDITHIPQAN
jgi:hypothetical protein